jgi:anti-sigma factor RsiW
VTIDPCRDWRGALGAAALGNIDASEEIGLRAHLDGCADCRAELRDLTEVAQALASVPVANVTGEAAEPSDALAGRVLDRVSRERGARRTRRTRRAMASVAAFAAAAAAVIAVVVLVGNIGSGSPGKRVVLPGVNGATASATLLSKSVGTEIDVKVAGLQPGHYYWMWLTGDDEHRVGAGTFRGSPHATDLRFTAAIPLNKAERIWVTDEKDHVVLDARVPA